MTAHRKLTFQKIDNFIAMTSQAMDNSKGQKIIIVFQ